MRNYAPVWRLNELTPKQDQVQHLQVSNEDKLVRAMGIARGLLPVSYLSSPFVGWRKLKGKLSGGKIKRCLWMAGWF